MRICIFLSALAVVLGVKNVKERAYFTAAVFERADVVHSKSMTAEEKIEINLQQYARAASEASRRGVDILVFPEYGLFPYERRIKMAHSGENVPDPNTNPNPCDQADLFADRPILFTLSCIARENSLYILANMIDKKSCDDQIKYCDASMVEGCQDSCPIDGLFMYNTDVAFDRNGNLIARYHKNHPYFEQINLPNKPEYVTFNTDFGTFGMIVCFDSVFQHTINLIRDHGVTNLLFPTHWFDDIVPLNAIEWQQAIALANNVNFIASNIQYPGRGTLGSGIYSGKYGALSYTYNPDGKSKLVVARVPLNTDKVPELPDGETEVFIITDNDIYEEEEIGEDFPEQCYQQLVGPAENNLTDYRCFKAQFERYTLKKLVRGTQELESCNNGFCCSIKYSAESLDDDYYLVAFNGTNDVKGFYHWQEESCFLVRCDPFDGKDCILYPSSAKTVFQSVEIKADTSCEVVYPTVSKAFYRLAPTKEWQVEKVGKSTVLKYKSESDDPLLKVGFMGRCYSRDPPFIPFYKPETVQPEVEIV